MESKVLYPLVEEFYSIQGEGFHSGRATYFVRLGGCDVGCQWCDSKESWNASRHPLVSAEEIAKRVVASGAVSAVITGGEPLMHNLDPLTEQLHASGVEIFLESSGCHPLSGSLDWICISPKQHKPPLETTLRAANELKVVVEKEGDFEWAESCATKVSAECLLYLQPEWNNMQQVIPLIVEYAKRNPRWMISIQTHKYMNIP